MSLHEVPNRGIILPEAIGFKQHANHGILPFEWLVVGSHPPPTQKKNTSFCHCFCLPSRTYGKILLLKTTHTLAKGHVEIKLVLILKFPSCQLAIIVPEDVMQAAGRKKSPTNLPTYDLC